jgi:hypothetical protein
MFRLMNILLHRTLKTNRILLLFLLSFFLNYSYTQPFPKLDTITAAVAAEKVGEEVVVIGKAVTTFYAEFSKGKPTFLNLEKPFRITRWRLSFLRTSWNCSILMQKITETKRY